MHGGWRRWTATMLLGAGCLAAVPATAQADPSVIARVGHTGGASVAFPTEDGGTVAFLSASDNAIGDDSFELEVVQSTCDRAADIGITRYFRTVDDSRMALESTSSSLRASGFVVVRGREARRPDCTRDPDLEGDTPLGDFDVPVTGTWTASGDAPWVPLVAGDPSCPELAAGIGSFRSASWEGSVDGAGLPLVAATDWSRYTFRGASFSTWRYAGATLC